MRLGQRLSGGVAAPLKSSSIGFGDGTVTMRLGAGDAALYGEAVERRHKNLAASFGFKAEVIEG